MSTVTRPAPRTDATSAGTGDTPTGAASVARTDHAWWVPATATSACVAVAVIASMSTLGAVIGPGAWTGVGVRLVLVLAAVTLGVRLTMIRNRLRTGDALAVPASLLPSATGLLVGCWALLGLFGGPSDRFSVIIGLSNVERILGRFTTARELIRAEVAPVDASLPIALLAIGGVVAVFLLADLVAGGLGLPAAAGIPLLALWVPGLVLTGDVPDGAFVVAVVPLLLLLAIDNPYRTVRRAPPARSRRRERTTVAGLRASGAVAGATAVTIGALLVGTASAALPEIASSSWSSLFSSTGQTVRLSADLDMRRNLDERSGEIVLEYRTEGDEVGPLRAFTLTGFDGTNWRRGADRPGTPIEGGDEVLWPSPSPDTDEPQDLTITLETLRDTKLPVPTEPRTVDAGGDWAYDPVRDEVIGPATTDGSMTYDVTVHPRHLDAEVLRASSGDDPDDANYREVVQTEHADDIRALAQEVAGDEPTRYDQALALQTYFRDVSRFTYSTNVPEGETGDAVWDFLQQRTGYCVQYATSMTVLARSLGIPARLAVGFLPGTKLNDDTYRVTGRDSHAWPELYFPGTGWVRFEPTPAQQTGATPSWATPLLVGPDGPAERGEVPSPAAGTTSSPTTGAPVPAPASPQSTADTGTPWWFPAVIVVVVLVLGLTSWWILRRRRGNPDLLRDAEDAWAEVRSRLEALEITWPSSTTPRKVPGVVAAQVRERTGAEVGDEVVRPFLDLVRALEAERYTRTAAPGEPGALQRLVEELVAAVAMELSDRPARADGPSALPVG